MYSFLQTASLEATVPNNKHLLQMSRPTLGQEVSKAALWGVGGQYWLMCTSGQSFVCNHEAQLLGLHVFAIYGIG